MLNHILNSINEGVIILDENLNILFWNDAMKTLTNFDSALALNQHLYDLLPNLNKRYFNDSIRDMLNNGSKIFFSAALHKDIISTPHRVNLKGSKIEFNHQLYILLEFIDVTSQFLRIRQLEDNLARLAVLNKKLRDKEKKINTLAYYDSLTGIANRTQFYRLARKFLNSGKNYEHPIGIIFVDIDKFKEINDTYGHKVGDEVIVEVSKLLKKATRSSDLVARFGGDEFLIFSFINSVEHIISIAERILKHSGEIRIKDHPIAVSLSLGMCLWQQNGETLDELISKADKAMYIAKRQGGNLWYLWEDDKDSI